MIEAQSPVITLDLADADSLDSVVLGQLVGIHLTCKRAGARLRLIHVSEDVEDVLAETKLLQILNVEK
jgi:anti-anti-sigma factor